MLNYRGNLLSIRRALSPEFGITFNRTNRSSAEKLFAKLSTREPLTDLELTAPMAVPTIEFSYPEPSVEPVISHHKSIARFNLTFRRIYDNYSERTWER